MGAVRKDTAAIVLAAGQGRRMHAAVAKQFLLLAGKPLIYYSLRAFEESPAERIILVCRKEEMAWCREEIVERFGFGKVAAVVCGGKERYHSVYAGLCAARENLSDRGLVLIHDGARPLVGPAVIERTIKEAAQYQACVAAMPVKDTIKTADADRFAERTLDRSRLWQIQTPQVFSYGLVRGAYERMFTDPKYQEGVTDDAMVVETMTGARVRLVEGSYENIKVTTPEDLVLAEALLKRRKYG
ncbi:MAG: 2-C-methyl-D-erythritol 4-phosphate cytidylyltransferase [Lachnospiraceae bacterium]|nr:2-C-methyl-D-erythritol 4-phosphate cytidylyltransferase [Lachnospiraceae bacterium]